MADIKIKDLSLQERARLFNEELQPLMKSLTDKYSITIGASLSFVDTTVKQDEPKVKGDVEEAQIKEVGK